MSAVVGGNDRVTAMTGGWEAIDAALILRGSGLDVGRTRLLNAMRELSWLHSGRGQHWPTRSAVEAGWLLRGVPVRVTGPGLVELWRALGGVEEIQVVQVEVMAA